MLLINSLECTREKAVGNSVDFATWLGKSLDILGGINAGLFVCYLRNVLGIESCEKTKELNRKIVEIQEESRKKIKEAILEFEPELKNNKWI